MRSEHTVTLERLKAMLHEAELVQSGNDKNSGYPGEDTGAILLQRAEAYGIIKALRDAIPVIERLIEANTNTPARPTFTPMTAGEAAKLPDIVGRWVAVEITGVWLNSHDYPLQYNHAAWMNSKKRINLIEGADLP